MNFLKVENVTKNFGGLQALRAVTLEVKKGSITTLIGPNGAGKTTFLNVINGLLMADEGSIYFNGENITNLAPYKIAARGVSRTFQILKNFKKLSLLENLMVGRHVNTHSSVFSCLFSLPGARAENKATEEAALESLNLFNLKSFANLPISVLPHGTQRLVEITRALISEPTLLLLDEPTSGLNPKEVEILLESLRMVQKKGVTILMIEHKIRFVMNVSDWLVVLNFGEKVAEGPPKEIADNPKVIEAYLGRKGRAAAY